MFRTPLCPLQPFLSCPHIAAGLRPARQGRNRAPPQLTIPPPSVHSGHPSGRARRPHTASRRRRGSTRKLSGIQDRVDRLGMRPAALWRAAPRHHRGRPPKGLTELPHALCRFPISQVPRTEGPSAQHDLHGVTMRRQAARVAFLLFGPEPHAPRAQATWRRSCREIP